MYAYIIKCYNNKKRGDYMTTQAQKEAAKKYIAEKTDEIKIRTPKGKKAEYMQLAAAQGQSLNAVINRLLQEWREQILRK